MFSDTIHDNKKKTTTYKTKHSLKNGENGPNMDKVTDELEYMFEVKKHNREIKTTLRIYWLIIKDITAIPTVLVNENLCQA